MTASLSKFALVTSLSLASLLGACKEDDAVEVDESLYRCSADISPVKFGYVLDGDLLTLSRMDVDDLIVTREGEGTTLYDVWLMLEGSSGRFSGRRLITFGEDSLTLTTECSVDGMLVSTVSVESRAVYTDTTIQVLDEHHESEVFDLDELDTKD